MCTKLGFAASFAPLSLLICLLASCSSGSSDTPMVPEDVTAVHVAFAGGGWRAHTAQAGWTMSLLDDGANTLEYVFENVQTLSSNSGGTWFLSMLVYSSAFRSSIEEQGAFENYITPNGYLGQERALFENFGAVSVDPDSCPFEESDPVFYFYCRLAALVADGNLVWTDMVNGIVFKPFDMNLELEESPTLLSDPRQTWAIDKSLLTAATMLTNHAVLTESAIVFDKLYYDATLAGGGPVQMSVTPVTFSSLPAGKTPPPFLRAGTFDVVYADADFSDSAGAGFMNPSPSDSIPVLLATAASSAAAGALASYSILLANGYDELTWELANVLSDLAVPLQLTSPLEGGSPSGLSLDELAGVNFARLADGAYLDNSAVAQLVSFLQVNNEATDFQIVSFDNVQTLYTPSADGAETPARVSNDIALLFGEGGKNQVCTGADEFCFSVPARQIFSSEPLTSTASTWDWTSRGADEPTLIYTRYRVTTVDNPTFGLTAGSQGVLHVFTCSWPSAQSPPWNGESDFDAYEAMLAAIRAGLQANGNEGLDHLRAALAGEINR